MDAENLTENSNVLLQFLLTTWCIQNNTPYSQMTSLLKSLKIFIRSLSESEEFCGFPVTMKTVFKRFEIWEPRNSFQIYCACENHHIVRKSTLVDDDHILLRPNLCEQFVDGVPCNTPFLKTLRSRTGQRIYRPLRAAPFFGITQGLRKLVAQEWFVSFLNSWETMAEVDISPSMGDFCDGPRFGRWKVWLRSGVNVLLILSIDW